MLFGRFPPQGSQNVKLWKVVFQGQLKLHCKYLWGFADGALVESACQCRRCNRLGFGPWVRMIPGEGNGKEWQIPWRKWHSSLLAWKIPWTEERDRLQSMRLQRVGHNRATEQNGNKHIFLLCSIILGPD